MSPLLPLLMLVLGALLAWSLISVVRPRRWHPGLRRLRRRLLGQGWRPVLMQPYTPPPPEKPGPPP